MRLNLHGSLQTVNTMDVTFVSVIYAVFSPRSFTSSKVALEPGASVFCNTSSPRFAPTILSPCTFAIRSSVLASIFWRRRSDASLAPDFTSAGPAEVSATGTDSTRDPPTSAESLSCFMLCGGVLRSTRGVRYPPWLRARTLCLLASLCCCSLDVASSILHEMSVAGSSLVGASAPFHGLWASHTIFCRIRAHDFSEYSSSLFSRRSNVHV